MTTIYWLSAINGSFTNPSAWSGGTVPGASDDAILDAVGSAFTVTLVESETVKSLQLASNATLAVLAGSFKASAGTGSGANAGVVLVGAGATLVAAGEVNNTGTIELDGSKGKGARGATLDFVGSYVTLAGGGEVRMKDGARDIIGVPKHHDADLFNVDNAIVGSGAINLNLINDQAGTIDANGPSPLVVAAGVHNAGLMEATGGGVLSLAGSVISMTDSGVLLAGDGSTVQIGPTVRVHDGTLKSAGSGTIVSHGAYIGSYPGDRFVIDTNLAGSCRFVGTIVNNGTMSASFYNLGAVTFSGDGVIDLDEEIHSVNGSSLALASGAIRGSGKIDCGLSVGAIGVIDGDAAYQLTLGTNLQTISNAGTIESSGEGGVVIAGALINTGTLSVQGDTRLEAKAAVSGGGGAIINGGTLEFLSSFNGAVTFTGSGTLALADSQQFSSLVKGFSDKRKTALDLGDIVFLDAGEATFSGTASGGLLTVSDGVHTCNITLKGNYLDAVFVASSDRHGGTDVIAEQSKNTMAAPHAFISAVAGFGASGAGNVQAAEIWAAREPMLTAPKVAIA